MAHEETVIHEDVIDTRSGVPRISKSLLESCIHCGLCLPACPTYLATGREMESPRGRIYLINQWQESGAAMDPRASEHIDSCLGCLGCQTACPSGVNYEAMLNSTRALNTERMSPLARMIMRFSFTQLLPHYGRLLFLGALLRIVQTLGLDRLFVRVTLALGSPPLLGRLAQWQMFVPRVPAHVALPRKSWKSGAKAGNVALFAGCVMDVFYNHVNQAAVRLLKKRSLVVTVPPQTCCGALAFHAGFVDIARDLARQNIDLLGGEDPVVVTAAGCGAMLKEYGHLLADDPKYCGAAQKFAGRVQDLSETLYQYSATADEDDARGGGAGAKSGGTMPGHSSEKIVYHAACHLAHAQGVRVPPAALLSDHAAHSGAHLYDLPEAEHCCGSAGIYNLLNTEMSLAVLDRKMKFIEESGADVVVTSNPGCMLQIEAGARARGLNVKVKHLAEALDDCADR